ncbi:MAG: acyl carrier protein [Chitinophagaceae bacterium]|nr:acyl carrier protein [Chitinophagaceae bacterium]
MDKENFLKKFRFQFDETEPELINYETVYKDLNEWSSMMALIIIAFIDDEYSISVSGDDFRSSNTVEDLYNIVKSKQ